MSTFTKQVIQTKIKTDVNWTIRTLEVIYEHQTRDEQESKATNHENGIGFNGTDAFILSSFAEQVKKKRSQGYTSGFLSDKQLEICRKKLPKYWGQVSKLIKKKEG